MRKRTLKLGGVAMCIVALCATSAIGTAQTAGGIYYQDTTVDGGSRVTSRMNGNGTGKTLLFTSPSRRIAPEHPSNATHGGRRWFVNSAGLRLSSITGNGVYPIVFTTEVPHGLFNGEEVVIRGVGGNTAANGDWSATVLSPTTFSIDATGNGDTDGYDPSSLRNRIVFTADNGEIRVVPFAFGDIDPGFRYLGLDEAGYPSFSEGASYTFRWVPGDAEISFIGRRLNAAGTVVETGLYSVYVEYDASGNPVGTYGMHLKFATPSVYDPNEGMVSAANRSYSWNPNAGAVAFNWYATSKIYTLDNLGPHLIYTASTPGIKDIAWGPNNKIAFIGKTGRFLLDVLNTISSLNGSGLKQIVKATNSQYLSKPEWSPDGAAISYLLGSQGPESLYRVGSTGSGKTKLYDFNWSGGSNMGWR